MIPKIPSTIAMDAVTITRVEIRSFSSKACCHNLYIEKNPFLKKASLSRFLSTVDLDP